VKPHAPCRAHPPFCYARLAQHIKPLAQSFHMKIKARVAIFTVPVSFKKSTDVQQIFAVEEASYCYIYFTLSSELPQKCLDGFILKRKLKHDPYFLSQ
jgi:hypothetical protein